METKQKNTETAQLGIGAVSDSNFTKKIVSEIRNDIEKVIDKHQKSLDKETDENKKQFLKGCITGLRRSLLTLPLLETL